MVVACNNNNDYIFDTSPIYDVTSYETVQFDSFTFKSSGFLNVSNGQVYKKLGYCSWPYNSAFFDESDLSINVFYCSKSYHISNDGVWLMKKYYVESDEWTKPKIIAKDSKHCYYGYAVGIDDNGDYIGFCKDQMNIGTIYKYKSEDKGNTWSREVLLLDGAPTLGDCPCSLKKLSNGRWCFYMDSPSRFVYSDDSMNTWSSVDLPYMENTPCEAEIVELYDGTLCLVVREGNNGVEKYSPYLLKSNDMGNTWDSPLKMDWLEASATPVTIIKEKVSGRLMIFHTSRFVENGMVTTYITIVSEDDLKNNIAGETEVFFKINCHPYDVGNTGYSSAVYDLEGNIHYFTYKGYPHMKNNTKIYHCILSI